MYVHLIYVLWEQLYEKVLKELFYEDFHDLLQQKRNRLILLLPLLFVTKLR